MDEEERKERRLEKDEEFISKLFQVRELSRQDRRYISNGYDRLYSFHLADSAFENGRISEYQYYRLRMEEKRNDLLYLIVKGKGYLRKN